MHFLKIHWRCINAVGCVKKRHAPSCIHKMQAILSVEILLGFVLPVLEYWSAVWCSAADTHLTLILLVRVVCGACFLTGVCLRVTLLIVDLWQYCVCSIRSGLIRCTYFIVLCLCRMCQCGLHAVLLSYIDVHTYAPPHCKIPPVTQNLSSLLCSVNE